MEDFLIIGVPVLIAIVAIGITALVIGVQLARFKRRRHLLQHGEMAVGRVLTISQTGTSVNDVPEMRLVVDVERAGERLEGIDDILRQWSAAGISLLVLALAFGASMLMAS